MNFSSLYGFLWSVGVALVIYSRTFLVWLEQRATEKVLNAQEAQKIMKARIDEYDKSKSILEEIAHDADNLESSISKKEEIEMKLRILNEMSRRNEEILMANVKMEIASQALESCSAEMDRRGWESKISFWVGIVCLIAGFLVYFIH